MLIDYSYFLLTICFCTTLFGAIAAFSSAHLKHTGLLNSAKMSAICTMVLSSIGSALLIYFLINHDYSVTYVYKNSSNDLPLRYLISAFWSSLEGSHLLWTIIMTVFTNLAIWTVAVDNRHLLPYISGTLLLILSWMYFEAMTSSNPFQAMRPIPADGLGMNELLQNPYMSIHPPMLFSGYSASAIPFAYSIAALFYGDITRNWLPTMRKWTVFAWTVLTVGIFLGGKWAYVELGWAGYWAWDPVENSSLMPWIFLTALMHALLVQVNIDHLKRLNILLSSLAFFFCFFGTFITRSGLMSSVHSFAESRVGPDYLIFLVGILIFTIALYILRAPSILPSNIQKQWEFTRESVMVVAQFIFAVFAIIVFVGTIYPIMSEAITGQRFNVQAPYFNSFAPYIGFGLAISMTLGNFMRYRKKNTHLWTRKAITYGVIAVPMTWIFAHYGEVFSSRGSRLLMQLVGTWICFWCILSLTGELFLQLNLRMDHQKNSLRRKFSTLGTYMAHIGMVVALMGFLGNYRGEEKTFHLKRGESTDFFGYHFTFKDLSFVKEENANLLQASLEMSARGKHLATLLPAKAQYPTKKEMLNETSIIENFWHDVYAVLSDFDTKSGQHATFTININPTVKLVWISGILLLLGGLLSLLGLKQEVRRVRSAHN